MLPHRRWLLACLVGLAVLATACSPQAAPAPVKIKIVNQPFISFAPFHIALAEGYFAEQGLEAELVTLVTTQEVLPALLSGEVDVAAGFVTAGLLNSIARGGNIRIVADKGYIDPNGCDNFAMLARASLADEGDPASPEVIRGKSINVVTGSWNEYYLDRLLATVGLTPADIEKAAIPSPSHLEALNTGALDYTLQNEPWVLRLEQAGHPRVLTPVSQLLPESEAAVVYFGPRLLDADSDVGVRFMLAYLKAVRQYNEGKTDRNIEILSEANNLDAETLRAMCWPALRADGLADTASLLDFQAWAVQAGHTDAALPLEAFWEPRFAEQAAATLDQ